MSKYRCPRCGSTDIVLSEETVTDRKYKFKKDGNPYKRPFKVEHDVAYAIYNLECSKCFESCNLNDKEYLKAWVVENENA